MWRPYNIEECSCFTRTKSSYSSCLLDYITDLSPLKAGGCFEVTLHPYWVPGSMFCVGVSQRTREDVAPAFMELTVKQSTQTQKYITETDSVIGLCAVKEHNEEPELHSSRSDKASPRE